MLMSLNAERQRNIHDFSINLKSLKHYTPLLEHLNAKTVPTLKPTWPQEMQLYSSSEVEPNVSYVKLHICISKKEGFFLTLPLSKCYS